MSKEMHTLLEEYDLGLLTDTEFTDQFIHLALEMSPGMVLDLLEAARRGSNND